MNFEIKIKIFQENSFFKYKLKNIYLGNLLLQQLTIHSSITRKKKRNEKRHFSWRFKFRLKPF